MRILLILILFFLLGPVTAQQIEKNYFSIADREAAAHVRLIDNNNATSASTNFDITYYRCEWEVDPTI